MALSSEYQRDILIRARARRFANNVKASNMALEVPDEIINWLENREMEQFFIELRNFGLRLQKNYTHWERKE